MIKKTKEAIKRTAGIIWVFFIISNALCYMAGAGHIDIDVVKQMIQDVKDVPADPEPVVVPEVKPEETPE